MFGSIEEADPLCRKITNQARCIVVAVGYRLAPEHPFPKGLQDCYEATKWVSENAHQFNGDRRRIGVGGESCGANLAAAVALLSRDKGKPKLGFQLLLYPALTNDFDEKVYAESPDQSFITLANMKMFWKLYLEKPTDGDDPYASPLKAKSLGRLPQAFIATAEYDPLHVEGEAYAKRLRKHHIPVVVKQYRRAIHYFLSLPIRELPGRREALQDIQEYLTVLQ